MYFDPRHSSVITDAVVVNVVVEVSVVDVVVVDAVVVDVVVVGAIIVAVVVFDVDVVIVYAGNSVAVDDFSVVATVTCDAHGMYPSSIHVLKSGSGVPWIISQILLVDSSVYNLQVLVGLSYKK